MNRTVKCFKPPVCPYRGADKGKESFTEMNCSVFFGIRADLYVYRIDAKCALH